MLDGLDGEKMSKSNPENAIFMEDTQEDVERKIKKALCPEKDLIKNPIVDYIKNIIFESVGYFKLLRDEKYGGDQIYNTFEEFAVDYSAGNAHPGDVKPSTARHINELLKPVRDHFANDPYAKSLLDLVHTFQTTK